MIETLAAATTLVCIVFAVWAVVSAVRGSFEVRRALFVLGTLEVALVVDAIADIIGLARGHDPKEPAAHLAYLVVSLLIAPAVGVQIASDNGRWAAGLTAVASLALAVVVIRAQTTWRTA